MLLGLSTNSSMARRSASAGSTVFSCSIACTVRVVSCTAALRVEIPIGDKQRFGAGVEKRAGKAGQRFGARLIPISGIAG